MFQVRRIDNRQAAASNDLDPIVRVDEGGGIFIQADAGREGIVGQRGQQPADPVALAEVLVDDDPIGEAEARRQSHHIATRGWPFVTKSNHMLAEKGRAGRGPSDVQADGVPFRMLG